MATIKVIAKIGDTYHPKYGLLKKGAEYEIDEQDYGDELFEKISAEEQKNKSATGKNKKEE